MAEKKFRKCNDKIGQWIILYIYVYIYVYVYVCMCIFMYVYLNVEKKIRKCNDKIGQWMRCLNASSYVCIHTSSMCVLMHI
jgi:hypothetical protein